MKSDLKLSPSQFCRLFTGGLRPARGVSDQRNQLGDSFRPGISSGFMVCWLECISQFLSEQRGETYRRYVLRVAEEKIAIGAKSNPKRQIHFGLGWCGQYS